MQLFSPLLSPPLLHTQPFIGVNELQIPRMLLRLVGVSGTDDRLPDSSVVSIASSPPTTAGADEVGADLKSGLDVDASAPFESFDSSSSSNKLVVLGFFSDMKLIDLLKDFCKVCTDRMDCFSCLSC